MNRNRANIFDRRRNIENYEMAEQPIQDLQLAIQQLREQHQQAINALQQQIQQQRQENEWIPPMFQLTADQILNRFHKIKTFNARGDYTLQEFLSAVENVLTLCGNNADLLQHGLQVIVREKIQGDAKTCIQSLGENVTWSQIKAELKSQFKPRRSYRRLFDEIRNVKVGNLRELFRIIRTVNFKLNELYEYDDNRPENYSPENNDRNLVDMLKDMLTGSYRVNIRNNTTLNEAYNIFDELGLLDEHDAIHYNFRKHNKNSHNHNSQRKEFKRHDNERHANNFDFRNPQHNNRNFNSQNNMNNSGQFRRQDDYRQGRNFYNNNRSGQYRQNFEQPRQFNARQNDFPNNSGQFRQRPNHNRNDEVVPMEVDNIQHQDVNFTDQPREESYQ